MIIMFPLVFQTIRSALFETYMLERFHLYWKEQKFHRAQPTKKKTTATT